MIDVAEDSTETRDISIVRTLDKIDRFETFVVNDEFGVFLCVWRDGEVIRGNLTPAHARSLAKALRRGAKLEERRNVT